MKENSSRAKVHAASPGTVLRWPGCLVIGYRRGGRQKRIHEFIHVREKTWSVHTSCNFWKQGAATDRLGLFGVKVFERLRGPDLLAALANPLAESLWKAMVNILRSLRTTVAGARRQEGFDEMFCLVLFSILFGCWFVGFVGFCLFAYLFEDLPESSYEPDWKPVSRVLFHMVVLWFIGWFILQSVHDGL